MQGVVETADKLLIPIQPSTGAPIESRRSHHGANAIAESQQLAKRKNRPTM
jgi:hypothetical protein